MQPSKSSWCPIRSFLPTLKAVNAVSKEVMLPIETNILAHSILLVGVFERLYPTTSFELFLSTMVLRLYILPRIVLHQLDPKIIYPHYDFKHLTEKYFEIGMKLDDFLIQLVKYCKEYMKFPWYVYSSEVSSCFCFKNRPHTVSSCCYNWNNSMINDHLVRSMTIRSSICNHKKWFMSFRFHALNGSFLKYSVVIFTCVYCVPINW